MAYLDNAVGKWDLSDPNPVNLCERTYGKNNGTGQNVDYTNIKDGVAGGKGVELNNGVSNEAIFCGTDESLHFNGEITFACMINTRTAVTSDKMIMSYATTGAIRYFFRLINPGIVNFYLDDGTTQLNLSSSGDANDSHWRFVAGSYDGDKARIVIDDAQDGESASTIIKPFTPNGLQFEIGSYGNGIQVFDGKMDTALVFDKGLTVMQLLDLRNKMLRGDL